MFDGTNITDIGSVTFVADGYIGTLSFPSTITVPVGGYIKMVAPSAVYGAGGLYLELMGRAVIPIYE